MTNNIPQIEKNIIDSFRLAKTDIINLQNELINLSQAQERIMELFDELKEKELELERKQTEIELRVASKVREIALKVPKEQPKVVPLVKTVTKTVTRHAKKHFVASKSAKTFHQTNCPFAQNIKPKSKIVFKSRVKALNEGFKPCKCVK